MAFCCGDGDENVKKSRKIDKMLRSHTNEKIKLLLLGPGESGKSTIFKQLKIIQKNGGFSSQELQNFRYIVYLNCISQMKLLVAAVDKLHSNFDSEENEILARKLAQVQNSGDSWTEEIGRIIKVLWTDKGIKKCYGMRNKFQLNDCAGYFFDNIDRLLSATYIPTVNDVLRTRVKSTGIEEAEFQFEDIQFQMIDVGGQRSERKKWIHCFDKVTAVIFCAAISEYDQTLREDSEQTRMMESLILFDEICNSHWFRCTPILLFLNKADLFKEKLQTVELKTCFPRYTGGSDFDLACEFVKARFIELNQSIHHEIYTQFTCALSTENMDFVFRCVREVLLKQTLSIMY